MSKIADMIPVEFYNLKKAGKRNHPRAKNVGELIELLGHLPKTLSIETGFGQGCEVTVFNHGDYDMFMEICEIED